MTKLVKHCVDIKMIISCVYGEECRVRLFKVGIVLVMVFGG
jgi:hypothetical protein